MTHALETVEQSNADGNDGLNDLDNMSDEELERTISGKEKEETADDNKSTDETDATTAQPQKDKETSDKEKDGDKTAPDDEKDGDNDKTANFKEMYEKERKYVHQRNAEIGDLRKENREMQKRIAELSEKQALSDDEIAERYIDDPKAAIAAVKEQQQRENDARDTNERIAEDETREVLNNIVKDFDSYIPKIAALAKEDGNPDELLEKFQARPYKMSADMLFQYYKRVEAREELESVRNKLKETKEKLDSLPRKITEAASGRAKTLTGKTSSSLAGTYKNPETDEQLAELSDEELVAIIKDDNG